MKKLSIGRVCLLLFAFAVYSSSIVQQDGFSARYYVAWLHSILCRSCSCSWFVRRAVAEDIVVHATQYGIFVQKHYYRDGYATFARVFCRTYIGL